MGDYLNPGYLHNLQILPGYLRYRRNLHTPLTISCFLLFYSWYHENLSREEAEDMLCRIPYNGAFLVRRRNADHDNNEPATFAISFR